MNLQSWDRLRYFFQLFPGLSKLLSHAGEVAEGDLLGVVVIEHGEHLDDILTGILLAHLAGHHAHELLEFNAAVAVGVDVANHLDELLVLDLESESTHGALELAAVDGARLVSIKESEDFTHFLDLFVGERSP